MTFGESQRRKMEEALKRLTDMDRVIRRSQFDPLFESRLQNEMNAAVESHRLIENSIRASTNLQLGAAIDGISIAAREAMEKTVAGFHALVVGSVQKAALESLETIQLSNVQSAVWADITTIRNALVHAHLAPSITALEGSLSKGTLELAAQAIAEANRINISKLGAISGSSALAALDFSKFSSDLEQIRTIHNSYSGQVAAALRDFLSSSEISDDSVISVHDLIDSKINSLPQSRVSAEGLLTLFLTLLSVLITYRGYELAVPPSVKSEKMTMTQTELIPRITDLIRQLVISTARLIPDEDLSTYYVVDRQVIIRPKPFAKSASLRRLLPEQNVRMVQRKHKWVYIEYFDEIEGVPKYGWAYKKYLRLVRSINRIETLKAAPRRINWSEGVAAGPGARAKPENLTDEQYLAITTDWEETNAKRIRLIQKRIGNNIAAGEERELEYLQRLADERIRLLAPLPIDQLKNLLNEVTRSK